MRRELVVALAADAEDLDLLAVGDQRVGVLAGEPHDRGVERAAQAALGGADEQEMDAGRRRCRRAAAARRGCRDRGGDVAEHLLHALGIGTRRLGRRLGTAQLRRRDHLHRLGDLLRRLGRGDAVAQVLEAGHGARSSLRGASDGIYANVLAYPSTALLSLAAVASSRSPAVADRRRGCRRAWSRSSASRPSSKRVHAVDRDRIEIAVDAGIDHARPAPPS